MKKIFFLILLLAQITTAQVAAPLYEVELLKNPNKGGKDTREVNAIMIFEKDALKIVSRRKPEVFKEFAYTEIKYVEHSYSKSPAFSDDAKTAVLTILTGLPVWLTRAEKHWLAIGTSKDYAVLKVENDNFRLLKMELMVRDFDVFNVNEDR